MRRALMTSVVVAAVLHTSRDIAGQATSMVQGQVVDSATGRPLAVARIAAGNRTAVSDSAGTFILKPLETGSLELRAQRIGYGDVLLRVTLSAGETVQVRLALVPLPAELEAVRVAGRSVPSRFADAYRRAAMGRGVFFVREQLDSLNARDYQSILNRVPTVRANDRGVTFARCQDSGTLGMQSKVQVWLDGRRTGAADSPENLMDILRSIPPVSIQIIEIYPSQSVIPAEFVGDACAVIAIWTRAQ